MGMSENVDGLLNMLTTNQLLSSFAFSHCPIKDNLERVVQPLPLVPERYFQAIGMFFLITVSLFSCEL